MEITKRCGFGWSNLIDFNAVHLKKGCIYFILLITDLLLGKFEHPWNMFYNYKKHFVLKLH